MEITNVEKWLEQNKEKFLPPVSNYFLYQEGQLTVMFVGGPNNRTDYHIQKGEEFFYQIKGDMLLKIIEKGKKKDIWIKEGEVLLLPFSIPHSPQRFPNTMGLVLERKRNKEELDILRFFVDKEELEVLYETTFHWDNVNIDMAKRLKEFSESKQCQTGKPVEGFNFKSPFEVNNKSTVSKPFNLNDWIDGWWKINKKKYNNKVPLFDDQEFKHKIYVWGPGKYHYSKKNARVWYYQLRGNSTLEGTRKISEGDSWLRKEGEGMDFQVEQNGVLMSCCQEF